MNGGYLRDLQLRCRSILPVHDCLEFLTIFFSMADSRLVPSQWETALLCNDVSHWLGASLESALLLPILLSPPPLARSLPRLIPREVTYTTFHPIFPANNTCVTAEEFQQLIERLLTANSVGMNLLEDSDGRYIHWDIPNAIFFSSSVITTIGEPYPSWTRLVCVTIRSQYNGL